MAWRTDVGNHELNLQGGARTWAITRITSLERGYVDKSMQTWKIAQTYMAACEDLTLQSICGR